MISKKAVYQILDEVRSVAESVYVSDPSESNGAVLTVINEVCDTVKYLVKNDVKTERRNRAKGSSQRVHYRAERSAE